jgi:hypothetical protein
MDSVSRVDRPQPKLERSVSTSAPASGNEAHSAVDTAAPEKGNPQAEQGHGPIIGSMKGPDSAKGMVSPSARAEKQRVAPNRSVKAKTEAVNEADLGKDAGEPVKGSEVSEPLGNAKPDLLDQSLQEKPESKLDPGGTARSTKPVEAGAPTLRAEAPKPPAPVKLQGEKPEGR